MADQWNNIGWTAQVPPAYYADAPSTPWQIPDDVPTVEVFGGWHSSSGGRTTGFVEFVPSVTNLLHEATGEFMVAKRYVGYIGMDGKTRVRLPATDINPGFTYRVTLVLNSKIRERFDCTLPSGTSPVNYKDLVRSA